MKNARHEKFVINLVKGKTQTDAAIDAGYSVKTARSQGSTLLTNPNIQQRRKALQELTVTDTVLPIQKRKELLSEQASQPLTNKAVTGKERVMAIAELNKMDGSYAPEKHAILGDILIEVVYKDAAK